MVAKKKPVTQTLTAYEYKPVWLGFVPRHILETRDEEGLPVAIPESYGKERKNFANLLNEFGALAWEPHTVVTFPGGAGTYIIFKREKVG